MTTIGLFLVLTFGITWSVWGFVLRAAFLAAHLTPTPTGADWLSLGGPIFLLGVFAPGIVAVALTAREGGADAVRRLLARIGQWQVGPRYYAFALLVMPVVKLGAALILRARTGAWPAFGDTHVVVLLGATVLSVLGQAGEEVGWRGYLLPRLAARMSLARASLVVGIVWALWHLPLFYMPGADTRGQSFPLYVAMVSAYSIALSWLYWRTDGSLLLVMLAHAAFNNMKDILPSAGPPSSSPFTFTATPVFMLTVALWWLVSAWLLVLMRGARLADVVVRP